MNASGEVEISPTGKFIGKLIQKDALLTISKGGLFKGESIISQSSNTPKTDSSKRVLEDKNKEHK